jgi:hypothetical protein
MNEDSVLKLQPYLRLLKLKYPVDDLIIELRSENGSSDSSSNNASVERKYRRVRRVAALEPEQIYLAVHRYENSVYYKRLEHEDYLLLQGLISGELLGVAIEKIFMLGRIPEEAQAGFLREAFQTWASLGWFIR